MKRLLLILLAAFGLLAGPAHAQNPEGKVFNLVADGESDTGYINVGIIASDDITDIVVGELFEGRTEAPRPLPVQSFGATPGYDGLEGGTVRRAFTWRCDRAERTLIATGVTGDGQPVQGTFQLRTPSCRARLTATIPQQTRTGRNVRIRLLDRWGIGDVSAQVCRGLAANTTRCTKLSILPGRQKGSAVFRPSEPGYWTVTVRGPLQRTQRTVAVGVKPRARDLAALPQIVATGDSLMQGLDGLLEDRLGSLANVTGDVHIGSGLSSDVIADWDQIPVEQRAAYKPNATVLFLGANDSYAMNGVSCCGPEWQAEYVRRARKLMQAYTRGGASLFYLTVPVARDPKRNVAGQAVNQSLVAAQKGLPRVHLIDVGKIFTPDGVYRENGFIDGEDVDIYQDDGIHLTAQAARIVCDLIIQGFEQRAIVE